MKNDFIQFLWSAGVETSEIHERTTIQYGDNFMSHRKVYKWMEKSKGQ
jgi:copper oxidase (laccase) domain-containing protein